MTIYYTEYPTGQFEAENDVEALKISKAKVVYKESENGKRMILIRDFNKE